MKENQFESPSTRQNLLKLALLIKPVQKAPPFNYQEYYTKKSTEHPIIHDEFVIKNENRNYQKITNNNSLQVTLSDGNETQKMSPKCEIETMKNSPWAAQFSEISEISGQEEMIDELKRF